MYKKLLLLPVMTCFITLLFAQSGKSTTAYAITGAGKGHSDWKEVRLVDLKTGKEIQSVFTSGQEMEILNARTGKPVIKKDELAKVEAEKNSSVQVFTVDANNKMQRVSNADIDKLKASGNKMVVVRGKHFSDRHGYDKPFATNSAAMAYDKKHQRLYYTPMGIAQLRYIDLKSKTAKIYYFEDEAFGVVKNIGDVAAQITRMVIASDGNGYALSNDANHLIRFTTGKKPTITDLGAITDAANARVSIHRGMGGDMIADKDGNLYLVTAYRNVFKINIETRTSEYLGGIKGLPEDYQTNGAAVEEGTKIIVASSRSTEGYYRFDLKTLQAEKITNGEQVYNASDLANANLVSAKKEKEEKPKEEELKSVPVETVAVKQDIEAVKNNSINIYPNPVTNGVVKISFTDQPTGKYNVQVLDMSGKLMTSSDVFVNSKSQVLEMKLPAALSKGNYLVKVVGDDGRNSMTTQLNVQ